MTTLLEKIRAFRKPVNEQDIQNAMEALEVSLDTSCPSIPLLEEVLKYYKAQEKQILSKDLLEWMQENDQVTFETDDFKVSIKTYVSARIQDTEAAFQWLIDHQYGDLIKDSLEFPKGELTPGVESYLNEIGLSYSKKSGIHPQSLKKIVSDRLKDGDVLPEEDNGIIVNYYDECAIKSK